MCGIAGILHYDRSSISGRDLVSMASSMTNRGPDDWGYLGLDRFSSIRCGRDTEVLADCWLGLAHRRLSIIDTTEGGWQPMVSADGNYAIVFNGEIYNFVELRKELQRLGHVFYSASDTEVLLQAYIQWQMEMLPKLVGMFAFAVLDLPRKRVILSRDFFGIKPLYYARIAKGIAFASEIKALLTLRQVPRDANPQRVYEFLRFAKSDYGNETFLKVVKQLPSAHYLELPLNGSGLCEPHQYWSPIRGEDCQLSFAEAALELRRLLEKNLALHLRSDVPVGAALSGGIDSSTVVGMMRLVGGPGLQIQSFTYVANDAILSEERWARLAAQGKVDQMHCICPNETDLMTDLDELVYTLDEPFGSTSMYAQNLVYRLAKRNGIKVLLDGQGADELLAGYHYFYPALIAGLWGSGRWLHSLAFLRNAIHGQPGFSILPHVARAFLLLLPPGCHSMLGALGIRDEYPLWLDRKWCRQHGVRPPSLSEHHGLTPLKSLLVHSLTQDSLPSLLRWQDRNSMAYSVESRVPFLTPSMVSFLYSLPDKYLIDDMGTPKAIMREAMRDVVPQVILERKDKIAFATPMQAWVMALRPWVERILQGETARRIPVFHFDKLRSEWEHVIAGRRVFDWRVWRWISFIKWVERFDANF